MAVERVCPLVVKVLNEAFPVLGVTSWVSHESVSAIERIRIFSFVLFIWVVVNIEFLVSCTNLAFYRHIDFRQTYWYKFSHSIHKTAHIADHPS